MTAQSPNEETIFDIARRIADIEARDDYLAQACGDNRRLQQRIRELLRLDEQDSLFSRKPIGVDGTEVHAKSTASSDFIGPYKIREKIGEGGMGVVYVAEQTEPVQRKVAIKVIKPGMDTKEVIARFEAERQALAFMEHPKYRSRVGRRRDGVWSIVLCDGVGSRNPNHGILRSNESDAARTTRLVHRRFAMPCNMLTKRESFIAISNHRMC